MYPIAPGGSTLLICLPLGARLATNVEQTPDGSLGTHHSPYPPLSVPEGRALSNPRRKSGDPAALTLPSSQRPGGTRSQSACPLGHGLRPTWSKPQTQVWGPTTAPTLILASRRDALSNDNRDNADNWLSATRTELGCRIMLSVISNTNYHELTIN